MMIDYKTLDDHELANLLKRDDELAFGEIYSRYWDKLYVLSRNRLGNPLESEEIVQDIFFKLWRRRHTLVLQRGFNNYLSVAVKFEVIDRLSRQRRFAAYEKEMSGVTELDQSTLQQLDFNELLKQLEEHINALPEKCQMVFRMQYEDGYTQRQIADTLDISEKTVEAHLAKARKRLHIAVRNPTLIFILIILFSRSKG